MNEATRDVLRTLFGLRRLIAVVITCIVNWMGLDSRATRYKGADFEANCAASDVDGRI